MYDIDGELTIFIDHARVILTKLLDTYDGDVGVAWWNTILTTEQFRIGSGRQIQTNGKGWLLHLCRIYHKVDLEAVPRLRLSLPMTLRNEETKTDKDGQLQYQSLW